MCPKGARAKRPARQKKAKARAENAVQLAEAVDGSVDMPRPQFLAGAHLEEPLRRLPPSEESLAQITMEAVMKPRRSYDLYEAATSLGSSSDGESMEAETQSSRSSIASEAGFFGSQSPAASRRQTLRMQPPGVFFQKPALRTGS